MALDIELETLRARWDQTEAYVSEVEAEYGPLPGARLSLEITKELIRHADAITAIIDEASSEEIMEECPICGGSGLVAWDAGFRYPCVNCHGTGLVPHDCP